MGTLTLYHAGFEIIEYPDVRYGRKNADFGQGFYLSPDREFSMRWARERRGMTSYLNAYELETQDLRVLRLSRDAEWFEYIFENRAARADRFGEYDVITGPVANDTLYDTWGITTSGLLEKGQALRLLMIGPVYLQTVLKTEKAAGALCFLGAEALSSDEIARYRKTVRREEEDFQEQFAKRFLEITESRNDGSDGIVRTGNERRKL